MNKIAEKHLTSTSLTTFAETGRGNVPAVHREDDPFMALAMQEAGSLIDGEYLKFVKGKWSIGENKTPVEAGRRYIADIHQLFVGWIKWDDGTVVSRVMGRVEDHFLPPVREALGDTDPRAWEYGSRAARSVGVYIRDCPEASR